MIKIVVNCEENDAVDIKCGGASILGYDFYIEDESNVEEYISFIRSELKNNNQPFIDMYTYKVDINTRPWTKEMIAKCIAKGY